MFKNNYNTTFKISLLLAILAIFSFASLTVAQSTSLKKEPEKMNGQVNAEEHRSTVANFVQTLLKTASSTEGKIGQQVRIIAQEQNNNSTTTAEAIKKIQTRNKIKIFLLGSDYKNLGMLRSEIVQTRNRLEQLNRALGKATSTPEIQTQIQNLEQTQTKIENFIKEQESKFSLFGWLVRLFKK